MKSLYIFLAAVVFAIKAWGAVEAPDTLSYAQGYMGTLASLAGKNEIMRDKTDFEEYIRGLESYRNQTFRNDSSYMICYILGGVKGAVLAGTARPVRGEDKGESRQLRCFTAGLRKIADGDISLPADTIAAMDFIRGLGKQDPFELDGDTCCRLFTAYGIMSAYEPDLEQSMEEFFGSSFPVNRQAFASGMADVIQAYDSFSESAYEFGKIMALSLLLNSWEMENLDFDSFKAGAEAALGLGPELIPREEAERVMELRYASAVPDSPPDYDKISEYADRLDISLFTNYRVDWKVTAGTVAKDDFSSAGQFTAFIDRFGISSGRVPGLLMVQVVDEDESLYESMSDALAEYPLPQGYRWFCGQIEGTGVMAGIMSDGTSFSACVNEAMADISRSGQLMVSFLFNAADALEWSRFTKANIGAHVAMEINGIFVYAPRVNDTISGGACCVSGLTPEEINRLFEGASMIPLEVPVEAIEAE